jgi:hypothetical protein
MNPITKEGLIVLGIIVAGRVASSSADLLITSIARQSDCTTLTWTSQPGEFYNVYWTDTLGSGAFWRLAAIHVPSGGTTTTWTDCAGGEALGAGSIAISADGSILIRHPTYRFFLQTN